MYVYIRVIIITVGNKKKQHLPKGEIKMFENLRPKELKELLRWEYQYLRAIRRDCKIGIEIEMYQHRLERKEEYIKGMITILECTGQITTKEGDLLKKLIIQIAKGRNQRIAFQNTKKKN